METGVDTAAILLLLSQAQQRRQRHGGARTAGLATRGRVFECKTCGRRFPTFQALGGHRASHRRPRPYHSAPGPHRATPLEAHDGCAAAAAAGAKVQGCPVCGLEFAVGQALGGHMRRHRSTAAAGTLRSGDATSVEGEDVGAGCAAGGICLDLNLAPSDNCAKCRKNAGLGDMVQSVQKTLILDSPL